MSKITEVDRSEAHVGESKGMRNHDHDLVHELSKRLDGVWRYDQYIANADGEDAPKVKQLWEEIKTQDIKVVERLKALIRQHVQENCF